MSIGDMNHWYGWDFDHPCTCYDPWNGVLPKPPCPKHGYGWLTWPSTSTGVTITVSEPEEEPVYDGPTEEFTLTLGVIAGYQVSKIDSRKKAIQGFLDAWHQVDNVREEPMLPVRVSVSRVGYPGGEEDAIIATGTRNPFWDKDAVAWRERVLLHVRELKAHYGQTTAQVTFSPTHLVYYRTPD